MGADRIDWNLDILVAEDTPSDIQLFEMALSRCGQVRSLNVVQDGQELLDYLRGNAPFNQPGRQMPNIIFMDLKMPRMTGIEVLQWLRHHPECAVIPTVMFSSSALDQDVIAAYNAGANAFFQKPATFEELQEVLKSILTFWSHAKRPPMRTHHC